MKRRVALILSLVLLCLLIIAIRSWPPKEPEYQGKPLRQWSQQWYTNWMPSLAGNAEAKAAFSEAESAIRAVGTNGIPFFLELLHSKEAPLLARIRKIAPRSWHSRLNLNSSLQRANELNSIGAHGLAALDTNAANAMPLVIEMLEDPTSSLERRLTLLWSLKFTGSAAEPAIPTLLKNLQHSDSSVRGETAMTLGFIGRRYDVVVPSLINFLEWRKGGNGNAESIHAMTSLSILGTNALEATPTILGLLNDPDVWVRTAATNCIRRINPAAASRVGITP